MPNAPGVARHEDGFDHERYDGVNDVLEPYPRYQSPNRPQAVPGVPVAPGVARHENGIDHERCDGVADVLKPCP